MTFNSYIFILVFLPVCLFLYYFLIQKERYKESNIFLFVVSVIFYLYYDWKCFLLLIIVAFINYTLSKKLFSKPSKPLLTLGIALNVLLLCFFKYVGFFSEVLAGVFSGDKIFKNIIMPLGISFFVFQQIAYLVDSYRKDGVDEHSIMEYLLFSFFFPCITSGPITYYSEMISQFRDYENKRLDYDNICRGLYLFSLGLAKKVLLAQPFVLAVETGYEKLQELRGTNAILIMLFYTFEIYLDFSGYSDMAIGVAKMFNITLPENFNSPYQAYNITDFWNRWHITLTRFLTKYIYIPLGGNRKGVFRTYLNIMIVFLISGIWHGATLNFIIWGVLHGLCSVAYRLIKKIYNKWHPAFQWMLTFGVVNLAWIFFGAPSRSEANTVVAKIISMDFDNFYPFMASSFINTESRFAFELITAQKLADTFPNAMMYVYIAVTFFILMCTENNMRIVKDGFEYKVRHGIITAVLLIVTICSMSGVSTFIYSMF